MIAVAGVLMLVGAGPVAQDSATAPPPLELLQRFPFDRLTLVDNTTFEIEPISPRPLPAYEPARPKGAARNADANDGAQAPPDENIDEVIIHLLEGPQRDFKVKRSNIKSIEYFEDMLLAEARRFMQARNYAKAFEYILAVQTRNPNWKGLRETVDTLLFEEATWALAGNDRDRGLRLLRELFDRNPEYPGVRQRLAEAYGFRAQEAISRGQYAVGRRILRQLREIDPSSLVAVDLTTRFVQRARESYNRGLRAEGGERLDALREALQIWPALEEAVAPFEEAFRAHPTVRVGVVDLPRPIAPWVRSPASARVVPLLYLPILADESEEAQIGRVAGQLAANVELGELGRRIDLTLQRDVYWSDGSRRVSAIDVVRALSDRAQPRSPAYQARWANLLDRIETLDVDRVIVRLRRTPLDPISWLTVPIGPAHAAWDGRVATAAGRLPVGNGPYVFERQTEQEARYVAATREGTASDPTVVPIPRIVRIMERRLPEAGSALAAFSQGEIDLLEHVPVDRVPTLSRDPEVVVGRYRLPEIHLIALDGREPLLRNRNLRRALSYALDRRVILEESVLKRPIDDANRPADGPFALNSYANAPDVPPLEYDLMTARMLVAGVRRELALPKIELTLEYPDRPEARAAVPRIAEMLRALGLVIQVSQRSESELEEQLRGGRRFQLAYRVLTCDEPLREAGGLICPGYDAAPESDGLGALASDLIRQRLLQLEQATDWNAARDLVRQIDRECRDELPILPLWQLERHFARRPHLVGLPEVADHLYQAIETWEITPWFVRDEP
ncbi:MAG: peptide ABC transporter substrate-binding protein [Isosphaeraceae bacterium]|jgi:peptide/nickel transport system substrate-binding protein|nr:MAG: peptide ABC transporter substrate-binding protein [Isosphaeraceae bacterium]